MDLFFNCVLQLKDLDECYKFFEDACTIKELQAIAQRVMVAKLLTEHRVYTDISEQTGASTATISRVNRSLVYGSDGYPLVFGRLNK